MNCEKIEFEAYCPDSIVFERIELADKFYTRFICIPYKPFSEEEMKIFLKICQGNKFKVILEKI